MKRSQKWLAFNTLARMESFPDHLFSLEPMSHEEEIIRATAEQLQKDFGEFSFTVNFTGKTKPPYLELFNALHPIVRNLVETQRNKLSSLLYRIDVSPAAIENAKKEREDMTFSEVITDQIIRRELKKVLYRKYYK